MLDNEHAPMSYVNHQKNFSRISNTLSKFWIVILIMQFHDLYGFLNFSILSIFFNSVVSSNLEDTLDSSLH